MLLNVSGVAVSYANLSILQDIDMILNPRERVGLVGENGVGKSTLLRVIAGEQPSDAGTVRAGAGAEVGYLPQTVDVNDGRTVAGLLDDALAHVRGLASRLRDLEAQMAAPDADLDAVFAAYDEATAAFELAGGYEAESRVGAVLDGLGLTGIDRGRDLSSLSGGERSRLALAGLLVRSPGVLLLDEPTNHLDAAALEWLEAYLADYRGGVLAVSHDRAFLKATVTRVVEIDAYTRTASSYLGDYDAYTVAKAGELDRWRRDYDEQQAEIKALQMTLKAARGDGRARHIKVSDGDKFIKHFKGQTADKTQAREIGQVAERLDRIQADPIPKPPKPLVISPDLDPAALHGTIPVVVRDVVVRYGERAVLDGVSLTVGNGERVAITGPNGAGKSTLVKVIAGEIRPEAGGVTLAGSVRLGVLPQTKDLPPGDTLIAVYGHGLPGDYEEHKAALISSGLFRYPELSAPTSGMSAGQRRKVLLARLIAMGANVLLLDEPTNHLSLDVLEAFEAALADFPGAVVAVSHDRRFLARFDGREFRLGD